MNHENIQQIHFHGTSKFTSCNKWYSCQHIGAAARVDSRISSFRAYTELPQWSSRDALKLERKTSTPVPLTPADCCADVRPEITTCITGVASGMDCYPFLFCYRLIFYCTTVLLLSQKPVDEDTAKALMLLCSPSRLCKAECAYFTRGGYS